MGVARIHCAAAAPADVAGIPPLLTTCQESWK
jgi:hypothetical protein